MSDTIKVELNKRELMFLAGSIERNITRLRLKVIPELPYAYDQLTKEAAELDAIFRKIRGAQADIKEVVSEESIVPGFHEAWGNAKNSQDYDKKAWIYVQSWIEKQGKK